MLRPVLPQCGACPSCQSPQTWDEIVRGCYARSVYGPEWEKAELKRLEVARREFEKEEKRRGIEERKEEREEKRRQKEKQREEKAKRSALKAAEQALDSS